MAKKKWRKFQLSSLSKKTSRDIISILYLSFRDTTHRCPEDRTNCIFPRNFSKLLSILDIYWNLLFILFSPLDLLLNLALYFVLKIKNNMLIFQRNSVTVETTSKYTLKLWKVLYIRGSICIDFMFMFPPACLHLSWWFTLIIKYYQVTFSRETFYANNIII